MLVRGAHCLPFAIVLTAIHPFPPSLSLALSFRSNRSILDTPLPKKGNLTSFRYEMWACLISDLTVYVL